MSRPKLRGESFRCLPNNLQEPDERQLQHPVRIQVCPGASLGEGYGLPAGVKDVI